MQAELAVEVNVVQLVPTLLHFEYDLPNEEVDSLLKIVSKPELTIFNREITSSKSWNNDI